ncbi:MAG: hypothetical protein IPM15_09150 [Betaproteobacteria bacterium]|nr:hypothetical protein [Betaproteobacteria bacterium]
MIRSKSLFATLALAAGTLGAATAAEANSGPAVQWSVTIGSPGVPVHAPRHVHVPAPRHVHAPVVVLPAPHLQHVRIGHRAHVPHRAPAYHEPRRWDADGDGIPNRRDRVYNPRWDRDGDGIPNRHDRHPGYPDRPGRGR